MISKYKLILGILILASVIAEFLIPSDEAHKHWWSSIPLFYALLGFLGCIAIIFISKWLGKLLLEKKEDYYDAG